MGGGQL